MSSTETTTKTIPSVASYYTLGRTGLRVSPICLGTMTFGTEWGWGADEATARAMFHRYLEAGGNFVDTADGYTNGRSEELVGRFMEEAGSRDRIVLATKFTFNAVPGDPNAGGNGRKNILRALEGSLRRLRTDYIDLYWLHAWDRVTPIEEVLSTLDSLVRAGKIRHFGLSDTPAWYAARMQTMAELRGLEPVAAMQLEYSLVERLVEREHVPVAQELRMGICVWGALAGGLLSGKYRPTKVGFSGEGRVRATAESPNPVSHRTTERNWRIADTLREVAGEVGRTPAEVALRWVVSRPGVATTILGATSLQQLEANLGVLEFEIPGPLAARLEEAGRPEPGSPYVFFDAFIQGAIHGGVPVAKEPRWFR